MAATEAAAVAEEPESVAAAVSETAADERVGSSPMTEVKDHVDVNDNADCNPSASASPSPSPSQEQTATAAPNSSSSSTTTTSSTEQLKFKIIKQVEYYFSDDNLRNDKFLMEHISKGNGFVSISLISSFRKMKKLTKENSLIVDALKESSQLVVSKNGTRVKRLNPLPPEIKDPNFRTVIVENLPEDHSEENIRKFFGEVGNINALSICDPHDQKSNKKAEKIISGKMHALLEYETAEAAEKAVATLNNEKDWRNGMHVQLLCKRLGYGLGKKGNRGSYSEKTNNKGSDIGVMDSYVTSKNSADSNGEEDGGHMPKERNMRKGRNPRSMGHRPHGSHETGNVSSIGDTSKPPPGPKMPDGTRGFTMGRGRPI